MKFSKAIPIIFTIFSSCVYAQETDGVDDIFQELAQRKTSKEEIKDSPEYEEEIVLRNTSTSSFLIVGEESFGFAQIREIITCAEGIIKDYLGVEISSNNKITLRVIPFSDEKYDKQFYIENINNTLMLRWDENLQYEAFTKFIMGAMLRNLVARKQLDKDYELPYFLELSLSILLEEKARGVFNSELAKRANRAKLLSLKESISITRDSGDKEQKELSAYWNLIAINRFFKNKTHLQQLLTRYLYNGDNFDIYENISKFYEEGDIDKYFKCIVYSELSSRTGGIMSTQESAEELLRLSFIRKDSINISLGDKDILKYCEDDEVIKAIRRRITEIKFSLSKINPIYFNTLVSLGEMFESALRGKENAFEEARLAFIDEFRYAKYMEMRAKMLLNKE